MDSSEPKRSTIAPKFIWAILVFLCLGHGNTKEKQTNSELQALICEPKNFV